MAVRLKKKPDVFKPPALSRSIERALLAVLMYFPLRGTRELASDLMRGAVPVTSVNVRKVLKAIKNYGERRLAFTDPAFHVFHARDVLKKYVGKLEPAHARMVGTLLAG